MKKRTIYRLVIAMIYITFSTYSLVYGQPPAPPGDHGLNGNQGPGGSAAIDGGALILLLGGLGYGAYKVIRANRRKKIG